MNFILFLDQLLEKLKTNLMLIFLHILHVKLLKFLIPNIFLLSTLERKNLDHYSFIRELANPSDELLCEWSIYCEVQLENLIGEIDLEEY